MGKSTTITTTTITEGLPDSDRLCAPGFGHLSIVGDGSHWAGPLAGLVRVLLVDLLNSGPIDATIWADTNAVTVTRYVGTVTGVDSHAVTFTDGVTVALHDVLSVTV